MAGAAANDVVWLDVLPSMKGFGPALTKQAGTASAGAGAVAGKSFGKAALAGVAVVAGGAALATKALYNVGATFNEMTQTIIVGTGASGDALKDLQQSAKNVGKTTPSSFQDIGTAIADLNTRLGLTGKPLEEMSSKFLNLSRITKTDLSSNIANATRVFGDWSISTKDQPEALDKIFEATKRTGIGLDQLTNGVVQFGAPLRQLGFSFEESLAMLGKFEKEGVNTQVVMGSMRIALGKMARAGEDPIKTYRRVTEEIKNAGSAGEANALALELFGAKAGPDMAAAIREGRFELDDMVAGLQNSGGAIDDADKRTRTFSESWRIFKNRVMVGVEPLATRIFDALGRGMGWVNDKGVPAVRRFSAGFQRDLLPALRSVAGFVRDKVIPPLKTFGRWMGDNKTVVATFVGVLAGFMIINKIVKAVAAFNLVLAANPIGLVIIAVAALAAGLVYAYKKSETFRDIVNGTWSAIRTGLSAAWSFIQPILAAVAAWVGPRLAASFTALKIAVGVAFTAIKTYISGWWAVASTVFSAVVWYVQNVLGPVFSWLWNNIISPAFSGIGSAISWTWNNVISPVFSTLRDGVGRVADAFGAAKDGIKTAWDKLVGIVAGPIDAAKSIIGGFIDLINKIPGVNITNPFGGPQVKTLSALKWGGTATGSDRAMAGRGGYAEGGWTGPGGKYTPAGVVHADEFVISKRARRAFEQRNPGVLDFINRTGQMPLHGAYAEGGRVVPGVGRRHMSGYPWATWAGDFPNPIGTPVKAWKDGVVAMVRSLTTSYGKHMLLNHTDGTSSLYAHLSSFAKSFGDRVAQGEMIGRVGSTGNSTGPHLHFETRGGPFTGGSGGGSVWDTLTGAAGQIGGWIKSKLLDKANLGGLLGNVSGLFSSLGNGVKDWALDKLHGKSALGLLTSMSPLGLASRAFDSGGLAAGTGFMAKNTIAPERVLSDRQTRAFEQMVRANFGDSAARGVGEVNLSEDSIRALGDYILDGSQRVASGVVGDYDSARRFDNLYGGNR